MEREESIKKETPESPPVDLSLDAAEEKENRTPIPFPLKQSLQNEHLAFEDAAHRRNLQKNIVSCGIAIAFVLYGAAIVMAGAVLYLINKEKKLDWHVFAIVASFIIPSTAILIGIIRAAFKEKDGDKSQTSTISALPTTEISKEARAVFQQLIDAIKNLKSK